MNLFHIGSELRRFRHGTLPPLALTVIIMLPLIFGGLFVWSYYDPIGHLNKLPVALVNSDTGAEKDGQKIAAGEQITTKLIDDASVDFHLVTAEEARAGIANGTYYFGLELPTDFSTAAISAASENPHPATISAAFSNTNGFMGVMLGNQILIRVVDAINEELGTQVLNTMLLGFNTIHDGMNTAADGATQLADGTHTASGGAKQLSEGTTTLENGINELNTGAQSLQEGATSLNKGLNTASQGAENLAAGMNRLTTANQRLGDGAKQISGGVDKLVGIGGQASNIQNALAANLANLSTQLRASGIPAAIQLANQVDDTAAQLRIQGLGPQSPLLADLQRLQAGAAEIAHQLADTDAEYRAGLESATAAAQKLATGLYTLADGSQRLVIGTNKLADGTTRLAAGSTQLTVGASQLRDGLVRLDEGSGELSLKLREGADQVPYFAPDTVAKNAETAAKPVREKITADDMTPFGIGLAPFFISLGLFVGGTTMFMVLHAVQRRATDSLTSPLRAALASYLPGLLVGLGQATVMWAVLVFAIGINPVHPIGLLISMWAISATFVAITQGINAFFGSSVGRVLCIAIMALSLVSSGGLYPVETQPALQRAFHIIDPITYSVNLLRQMIVGTYDAQFDHRLPQAILALLIFGLIMLAVTAASAYRDRLVAAKDLHPELAV
ncbi:YhgE/Pip domain-containing protein [Corynebacterium caspium]|uniref:YhgE/Pip domain-containing protein n=1 Tax=Corynebacterium caspium TaxID=234828 RepID=UPI000374B692|nr:YhgE/Pip domain-containing protein [Corynebacterium caspium]WKD59193.1 ABC-2 family transporter protein [Corynebacterium caspium DSM 44850]